MESSKIIILIMGFVLLAGAGQAEEAAKPEKTARSLKLQIAMRPDRVAFYGSVNERFSSLRTRLKDSDKQDWISFPHCKDLYDIDMNFNELSNVTGTSFLVCRGKAPADAKLCVEENFSRAHRAIDNYNEEHREIVKGRTETGSD